MHVGVCVSVHVRVYRIPCTHEYRPSARGSTTALPSQPSLESAGRVCFLSGPELWSEGDKGATKAGISALPDLLEASKQSGPLRSATLGSRILEWS